MPWRTLEEQAKINAIKKRKQQKDTVRTSQVLADWTGRTSINKKKRKDNENSIHDSGTAGSDADGSVRDTTGAADGDGAGEDAGGREEGES